MHSRIGVHQYSRFTNRTWEILRLYFDYIRSRKWKFKLFKTLRADARISCFHPFTDHRSNRRTTWIIALMIDVRLNGCAIIWMYKQIHEWRVYVCMRVHLSMGGMYKWNLPTAVIAWGVLNMRRGLENDMKSNLTSPQLEWYWRSVRPALRLRGSSFA